jgi:protease II
MAKTALYKNLDFRVAYQKDAQEMLLDSSKMSEQSDFFKLAKKDVTPSTNQPNAYFMRGLSYMINEPMIRDQDAYQKRAWKRSQWFCLRSY